MGWSCGHTLLWLVTTLQPLYHCKYDSAAILRFPFRLNKRFKLSHGPCHPYCHKFKYQCTRSMGLFSSVFWEMCHICSSLSYPMLFYIEFYNFNQFTKQLTLYISVIYLIILDDSFISIMGSMYDYRRKNWEEMKYNIKHTHTDRTDLPLFSTVFPSNSCCYCPVGISLL